MSQQLHSCGLVRVGEKMSLQFVRCHRKNTVASLDDDIEESSSKSESPQKQRKRQRHNVEHARYKLEDTEIHNTNKELPNFDMDSQETQQCSSETIEFALNKQKKHSVNEPHRNQSPEQLQDTGNATEEDIELLSQDTIFVSQSDQKPEEELNVTEWMQVFKHHKLFLQLHQREESSSNNWHSAI